MFTTLNGTVFICEFTFYLLFCVVRVFGVCVYYVYLYMGQVPELKLMMMMILYQQICKILTMAQSTKLNK